VVVVDAAVSWKVCRDAVRTIVGTVVGTRMFWRVFSVLSSSRGFSIRKNHVLANMENTRQNIGVLKRHRRPYRRPYKRLYSVSTPSLQRPYKRPTKQRTGQLAAFPRSIVASRITTHTHMFAPNCRRPGVGRTFQKCSCTHAILEILGWPGKRVDGWVAGGMLAGGQGMEVASIVVSWAFVGTL